MTGPVTLGDLAREDKLLWVFCRDCCHERDVDPATIPLPGDAPVPDVGKRMKCSKCGSRKIDARPELYPSGVVAMRQRIRDEPITTITRRCICASETRCPRD
jgi:hypothetical protein